MKPVAAIALGAFTVGFLYMMHRHFNLKRLKIDIYGLDGGFAGNFINLNTTLLVQNSTDSDFTINGAAGNIVIAGQPIGYTEFLSEGPVPAKSQSTYDILLQLPIVTAVADLVNIITGNTGQGVQSSFEFNGYIYINRQPFPIDLTYNLV